MRHKSSTYEYYIDLTQMRSAVKPAQHPQRFQEERRIQFWRAVTGMFLVTACLLIALYFGAFNWLGALFGMDWAL